MSTAKRNSSTAAFPFLRQLGARVAALPIFNRSNLWGPNKTGLCPASVDLVHNTLFS